MYVILLCQNDFSIYTNLTMYWTITHNIYSGKYDWSCKRYCMSLHALTVYIWILLCFLQQTIRKKDPMLFTITFCSLYLLNQSDYVKDIAQLSRKTLSFYKNRCCYIVRKSVRLSTIARFIEQNYPA
jgi:hypothetical protein